MSKYSDSVADMFIKAMEEGTAPWQRPWGSSPYRERFVDELSFYHTVFHEMAHATGASQRLNRDFGPFASSAYAFEELVAEITSFLVGRSLGCGSEPREESVNYVASWIEQVKKDSNVLFKACKLAEEACK